MTYPPGSPGYPPAQSAGSYAGRRAVVQQSRRR